jgi:hypothetical protein
MIPLPFIEPKAGYPIYRLKLDRFQQLMPGASPGLDTICEGILSKAPFVLRDRHVRLKQDTAKSGQRRRSHGACPSAGVRRLTVIYFHSRCWSRCSRR